MIDSAMLKRLEAQTGQTCGMELAKAIFAAGKNETNQPAVAMAYKLAADACTKLDMESFGIYPERAVLVSSACHKAITSLTPADAEKALEEQYLKVAEEVKFVCAGAWKTSLDEDDVDLRAIVQRVIKGE